MILSWLAKKLGTATPVPAPAPVVRSYAAGRLDRLSASFGSLNPQSADSTIRFALPLLRSRSRDLAENNDYVAGYLELLGNKIIGPKGIRLQVKSRGGDGQLDRDANNAIETAWQKWGKKGSCDISGRLSWVELQRLALISMARDGEVFIRKIKKRGVNRFNFTLQIIEADLVDTNKNENLANSNTIRMGIEIDQFDKPVAYYVFDRHPGDLNLGTTAGRATLRIPAEEMIHLFRPLRPGQTRGVPWTAAVMTRLHHMGAYEEAAIINARTGASKMGFFTKAEMAGDYRGDGSDRQGNIITEVEPGQLETLPPGYDFKAFDPAYPSNEYDSFVKRQLKGSSCGLPGATYSELSNDLESVSFSSIRQGTLNARDSYRSIQQLLVDVLCDDVYADWLGNALDFGCIVVISAKRGPNSRLSPANFDKYNVPKFVPRGWEWVDPLKDQQANTEALLNKTTTRSRIAAEQGEDFEDILAEQAQDEALAAGYGISLTEVIPKTTPKVQEDPANGPVN